MKIKTYLKFSLTLLIAINLSSCAFHYGTMESSASLSGGNFEIVDLITSKVSTKKYFGIGGLDKSALVYEAKKKLYQSIPLTKGQALGNISVDFQEKFLFFINTTTVTLSADLIQYDVISNEKHLLFKNIELRETEEVTTYLETDDFFVGEEVFLIVSNKVQKGTVKVILNNLLLVNMGDAESLSIKPEKAFHQVALKQKKFLSPFITSEEVEFIVDENKQRGMIVGYNGQGIIIENKEGLFAREYSQVRQ